jgi:hypothetical protein
MAACSFVRIEEPVLVHDADRTLSAAFRRDGIAIHDEEATGLDRAALAFRTELRSDYVALAREMGLDEHIRKEDGPRAVTDLHQLLRDRTVLDANDVGFRRAMQRIADDRAGLVPARPRSQDTPLDRALRIQASLADRLEMAVAREIGTARAEELRQLAVGWPGSELTEFRGHCPTLE